MRVEVLLFLQGNIIQDKVLNGPIQELKRISLSKYQYFAERVLLGLFELAGLIY